MLDMIRFCHITCGISPSSPLTVVDEEVAIRQDLAVMRVLRERRLKQMKKMAKKRKRWMSLGHGEYTEIPSEKDFFAAVKASERVVCHFYRENWSCKVMDKHLNILAKQHIEIRFVKIQDEKSPFLAERLKIVVLPTLALVKNTKADDYVDTNAMRFKSPSGRFYNNIDFQIACDHYLGKSNDPRNRLNGGFNNSMLFISSNTHL